MARMAERAEFQVNWRPFQLNAAAPKEVSGPATALTAWVVPRCRALPSQRIPVSRTRE